MKFDRADRFKAEYQRLSLRERELFRQAVRSINAAHRHHGGPGLPRWPAALRIKRVSRTAGVWELTWSFAGPDGRATFELIEIDGEMAIRWRRIGDHSIFQEP